MISCGVCGVILHKGKCGCPDLPHRKEYIAQANKRRGKQIKALRKKLK